MPRHLTTAALALTLLAASLSQAKDQVPPAWLTLPQQSVASSDDALALLVNPAGLGVEGGGTLYLLAPYQSQGHFEDWGVVLGDGLGFAAEALRSDTTGTRRRYTWGLGFGDEGTYCGFAYSWTTGIDRQNTWDIGILERPFRFLSLGLVGRGINSPRLNGRRLPVGWDAGVGFRPLALLSYPWARKGDRLTITADAYLRRFDELPNRPKQGYFEEVDTKFGAAVEIIPGLTGRLDYSPEIKGVMKHDARMWGGLSFNFGTNEVGSYQRSGAVSGVAYASFQEHHRPTWLKPKKKRFVVIELEGPVVLQSGGFAFFRPHYRSISDFYKEMEQLTDDPEVAGLLLKLGDVQCGWSKLQELRGALERFKASGKPIHVYMESAGNGEYYLASVADKIYLAPASDLDLVGLSATMFYLRGTLRKIGIEPEIAHIGAYKSASDIFMREDMSDAEREATDAVLDDIYAQFTKGLAEGRGKSESDIRAVIDRGPFTSDQALKEGLVDSLVYEDQLEDIIKAADRSKPSLIEEKKYRGNKTASREWNDLRRKSIAVVYGSGAIMSGQSSDGGLFGGPTMGSETIAEAIRQAREDDEVAAIVFRVDSPGGSSLASEMILREVRRCREGDNRKPFIVSMSDVAGSGGYYVACLADTIVAMPGTITGSIGVFGGKFSMGALEKKIGLGTATLKRGKFADWTSSDRPFTDEEWEKLRSQINATYQIFLRHVAEGRGMDTAAVHKIAQGRIWSGSRAKEIGLVDTTGGLDLAMVIAAAAAGIKEGETYTIEQFPKSEFEFGIEFETFVRSALPRPLLTVADRLADRMRWGDGEILLLMPFDVDIH